MRSMARVRASRLFEGVETDLGRALPSAWREFMQRERWREEGWLKSGAFVQVYEPRRALEVMTAWSPAIDLHPGLFLLGGDGSREMYGINLDEPGLGVVALDVVSSGWADAPRLNMSLEQFITRIDDGTFDPLSAG
jgi:hypothetical protein